MTSILATHDLVVVGGGICGVSASIAAARRGLSVGLVEKGPYLGGLATMGLVAIYLPLCDGKGKQVVGGIAEELLHLSLKYGPGKIPGPWQDPAATKAQRAQARYQVTFNPASLALALDELMLSEGVSLYLDTLCTGPILEGRLLKGVVVEGREGNRSILAKTIVDATGDALLAQRAGASCLLGQNWLSSWFYYAKENGGLHLGCLGADAHGTGENPDAKNYRGLTSQEVTTYLLESRKLIRAWYQEHKDSSYPAILPAMAQLRTPRRIQGATAMDPDIFYEDRVGLIGDWRRPGPVHQVPFRALYTPELDNLLVAGRCMAAKGDAWEIMRVIPAVALTGEVAGTAASMLRGDKVQDLDIPSLQRELRKTGALLDENS
jgi:hypothetical protein